MDYNRFISCWSFTEHSEKQTLLYDLDVYELCMDDYRLYARFIFSIVLIFSIFYTSYLWSEGMEMTYLDKIKWIQSKIDFKNVQSIYLFDIVSGENIELLKQKSDNYVYSYLIQGNSIIKNPYIVTNDDGASVFIDIDYSEKEIDLIYDSLHSKFINALGLL